MLVWTALTLALAATPSADTEAALKQRLLAFERAPTRAELVACGPDAAEVLLRLAGAPGVYRSRAVGALAHFPSEAAARALEGLLDDPRAPVMDRVRAAHALRLGFSDAAVPTLVRGLEVEHALVRAEVARALVRIDGPRARAVVQALLPRPDAAGDAIRAAR